MRKWEEDTSHFPQPQTVVAVCSQSSNVMRKPISISVFNEISDPGIARVKYWFARKFIATPLPASRSPL